MLRAAFLTFGVLFDLNNLWNIMLRINTNQVGLQTPPGDVYGGLSCPDAASAMTRTLLIQSGWLPPQFRVFNDLRQQDAEGAQQGHAWSCRPPPTSVRHRRRGSGPSALGRGFPPPPLYRRRQWAWLKMLSAIHFWILTFVF